MKQPGIDENGMWDFWDWLDDLARMFQEKTPHIRGFGVETHAGFRGITFTLQGEELDIITVQPVHNLSNAVEEFARTEAKRIAPNILFKIETVSDRRVICNFDIGGI